MSIARMSAGSGYRYVMRQTVTADVTRAPGVDLMAYYAATGNPPGRWMGRGLDVLGGGGLKPGTIVTEKAMAALYGTGHDPVTGEQLGRPYPVFKPAKTRIAAAIAGLPDALSEQARAAAVAAIEARVAKSPSRSAVAGYDLTFTVPKSASVLWALGDETVQGAVAGAHEAALAGVLELIEDRFLHTRTGAHSCMQVPAQGLIAAAFNHYDSRAGDPHLHTHVVVANKVQGPDGAWRSVDGQELYGAAVALSETYIDFFADQLTQNLPVSWSWRERGPRRSPAFEIDGITEDLLTAFSQRSAQIGTELAALVEEFTSERGREPSRTEVLRLRQRATLATRPDKQVRPLAEMRDGWRTTATAVTGKRPEQILDQVVGQGRAQGPATDPSPEVQVLAQAVVAGVAVRRATWTRANLLAEAARATRHLRLNDPSKRIALLDQVVEAAMASCVALDPAALFHSPARFRRVDGTSVFDRPSEAAFTTTAVLDAEARLLAAVDDLSAPVVPAAVLSPLDHPMPGQRLSPDQYAAVTGTATSARRLDVLVGPAGTGKTRTLAIVARAWAHTHGPDSVLGLAPSATAAAELALALGVACENTAKWLHETTVRTAEPAGAGAGAGAGSTPERWSMRAGQLVIVDEASMVSTAHLDSLLAQARAAGAKLLLTGDHHQLAAVEAGGAFSLLAETGHAFELGALWRFRQRWEAEATRALRTGDPTALDAYAHHHRLHDGPADLMQEAAYAAWAADLAAGHSSILLAPDRDTVTALNARAHQDRVAAGHVASDGLPLSDGTTCSAGDVLVTRRNDRCLATPSGHVRNGDLWRLERTNPDGSIDITPLDHNGLTERQFNGAVRLPADYVADHVELGYAATIHRAQGATVDTAHLIARPGMSRQQLYVGLTRGRSANHVYAATGEHSEPGTAGPDARNGRQILEEILATDGAEHSATATLRMRQDRATSLDRLLPIRNILAAARADNGGLDPELTRAAAEVAELIRARAAEHRQGPNQYPSATPSRRPAPGPELPGR